MDLTTARQRMQQGKLVAVYSNAVALGYCAITNLNKQLEQKNLMKNLLVPHILHAHVPIIPRICSAQSWCVKCIVCIEQRTEELCVKAETLAWPWSARFLRVGILTQ